MNKNALRSFLVACLVGLAPIALGAFTLEPMSALLAPAGGERVVTFRIRNEGNVRVAVRCSILSREVGSGGSEMNAPADELFVIYPSRAVVEPGSSVPVKIQWKGPGRVAAERSFRFVAEQVVLDTEQSKDGSSGIKILYRYIASLYVGDPGFSPDLVASVTGSTGSEGENGYLVRISNRGTRHVIANSLHVAPLDEAAGSLSGDALASLSGVNYLAGTVRTVFVAAPEAVPGKTYAAKVLYESEY